MNNCSICDEINGLTTNIESKKYAKLVENHQTNILSSENFMVVPSLGALNQSHVLIVPRKHCFSFAEISTEFTLEYEIIKQLLSEYVFKKSNKKLIFFEHGTGCINNNSGACVEHAHLHAVWGNVVLDNLLKENLHFSNAEIETQLSQADLTNGYIFYEDLSGKKCVKNNPTVPSQFFRYLYAKADPTVTVWNWRSYTNLGMIKEVLEYYAEIKLLKF